MLDPDTPSSPSGAYGLALHTTPGDASWWNPAPPGWEPWKVEWSESPPGHPCPEHVDEDRVRLRLRPAGHAEIDREAATTTLFLPRRPSLSSLVHPYLGSTAVAVARWQGWEAFHAGGFVIDGKVWGVLGDR